MSHFLPHNHGTCHTEHQHTPDHWGVVLTAAEGGRERESERADGWRDGGRDSKRGEQEE